MLGYLRPKTSGILIETNVASRVFVDGREVGRTPYNATLSPHTTVIKLIPYEQSLVGYETKVDLVAGIKTIIRRTFAQTESASSGQIIYFEKIATENPEISVVSSPDAASVVLDGRPKGFTPIGISQISLGIHQLSLTSSGYTDLEFSVKTVDGYKLIAIVKLAQTPEVTLGAQAENTQTSEVEVLRSPSGFLKIKESPNSVSSEVGQANTGQKYKLLNRSSDSNWYEIDLGGGKSGWISVQYATISGVVK